MGGLIGFVYHDEEAPLGETAQRTDCQGPTLPRQQPAGEQGRAIEAAAGFVFKTVGDGCCAAFATHVGSVGMSLWVMAPPVPGPKKRAQSGGKPGIVVGSKEHASTAAAADPHRVPDVLVIQQPGELRDQGA